MNFESIKKIACETISSEFLAIQKLIDFVNDDFAKVVQLILQSTGRVIVTGIGKSAIIAQKITATLNSTGTPAIFMHAADAIHGDLGIVQPDDIVICLSKSGSSPEIKVLVPLIKNFGNSVVAIVSNAESFLAKEADFVIQATVEREACPNNLAPTNSTTAQLVMGDALAVCLLESRNFSTEDFAKYHPGGMLGKQLYLKVRNLYVHNEVPKVSVNENIKNIILEISSKRLGCCAVLNENRLVGIITDGDLRRMLQKHIAVEKLTALDIMSENPKTIQKEELAIRAFEIMKKNNITQLLVMENNEYLGIVHLHDLLKEGFI